MLNEEAETEKESEDCVGLTSEHEEKTVPYNLVEKIQPRTLISGVGERIEVEMLDGV